MSVVRTVRETVGVARRAQISVLAAGLAYFGFTSLLPLALLAVLLFTAVADEAVAEQLIVTAASFMGDELGETVVMAVFAGERRLSSSVVGIVVLVWSAGRLFRGMDGAFAAIYAQREEKSLVRSARDGVVVFVTILLALVLLAAIAAVFGLTDGVAASAAPVVLFVALVVLFLPMFYVFPLADVSVVEVLPGTVLAAGAWAVASVGFGVYAGIVGTQAYGAATAAILVLTWLYVGGLALLFGATLNAVLAGRVATGDDRTEGGDDRTEGGDDRIAGRDDRIAGRDDRIAGRDDRIEGR